MTRIVQKRAQRGSQKWLQELIELDAPAFSDRVADRLQVAPNTIHWLSPRADDEFAEYRDQTAMDLLGARLSCRSLHEFWPGRGPVWDGLGRTDNQNFLLVEAKAHIAEMFSPPTQAGPKSRKKIESALHETQEFLGVDLQKDWTAQFYQYANRLAHLYLLREVNRLQAWLVFVYFMGDSEMRGPDTAAEWKDAIKSMKSTLGLNEHHALAPYIIDVFIPVSSSKQEEVSPTQ